MSFIIRARTHTFSLPLSESRDLIKHLVFSSAPRSLQSLVFFRRFFGASRFTRCLKGLSDTLFANAKFARLPSVSSVQIPEIGILTGRFERIRRRPRASSRAPCTLSARHRFENNHSPVAQIVATVGWSLQGLFAYANRQSTAFLRARLSFTHYSFRTYTSARPRGERNVTVNIVVNADDLPYRTNPASHPSFSLPLFAYIFTILPAIRETRVPLSVRPRAFFLGSYPYSLVATFSNAAVHFSRQSAFFVRT